MGSYFIPVKITEGQLESNISIDSDSAKYGSSWKGQWTSGTSYAKGDVARKGIELYQSTINNNSGNDPATTTNIESPKWIHLWKINRWGMFDEFVNTDTEAPSGEQIITTVSGLKVDQVALFNVRAKIIKIEIIDANEVVRWVYKKNIPTGRDVGSWYEFFFKPFPPHPILDYTIQFPWMIRGYVGEKVKITLIGGESSTVSCGNCDFGVGASLGITQWDAKAGGMYFGQRKRDKWGRIYRKKGATAKLLKCELRIPRGSENYASRTLSKLLDETVIFDLNNKKEKTYEPLIIKGFLTDYWESLKGLNHTTVSMTIEGLI